MTPNSTVVLVKACMWLYGPSTASRLQAQKDALLKVLRKGLVVKEHIRILEFPVEPILDLLHTAHDS